MCANGRAAAALVRNRKLDKSKALRSIFSIAAYIVGTPGKPFLLLGNEAPNMAWEPGLKVEEADPSWSDRNARHSYAWLTHLIEITVGTHLSKVATRCLFKFLDQTVYLGHRCLSSDHNHFGREPFCVNCDGDGWICTQRSRARRRMAHLGTGDERSHHNLASVPLEPGRDDPGSAIFGYVRQSCRDR